MPRFLSLLGTSALLIAAGLGQAAAADMPSPQVAPVVQIFSWSGFYIGGNAGYGWVNGSGTLHTAAISEPFNVTNNGFLGGAQAGYNWQVNSFVLGAEADIQATGVNGPFNSTALPAVISTEKTPWFATFRGRAGFGLDKYLLFVTGGAVYGDRSLSGTLAGAPFSTSATFWSWTVGAGVEAAFWNCWSAKLEYLFVGTPSATPPITTVTSITNNVTANIVRAGINYHF